MNSSLSEEIGILSTVYIAFLTPSVIGSFSVLMVSIARWRHLKEQVQILVQLAFADLLATLGIMSTSVMNKVGTGKSIICQHILLLSLIFYFISFLLVVVYAWKSKNAIQGWRDRPANDEGGQECSRKNITIPIYVMVWMVPITLYLAYTLLYVASHSNKLTMLPTAFDNFTTTFKDNTDCTSCILLLHLWKHPCSDTPISYTFISVLLFIVVISVMVSCSVIYYKVGKWYERHENEGLFPIEGIKTVFCTTLFMLLVIVVCWTPALVVILSSLLNGENAKQQSLFGIYVIQAASVSLQGFLNSMVYAWRRPNFTKAVLRENTPLLQQDCLAFFDESLKCSSYLYTMEKKTHCTGHWS
ncbi:uncharacterized protein KZ484_008627 [Pholidichthys leucotaenia]